MTNYERCRYTDQRRVNLDHARAIDYADTTHVSRISSCNVNVDLALALAVLFDSIETAIFVQLT